MSFRSARKRAGLKGSDVARALGVSTTAFYAWEAGRGWPKVEKLLKLRRIYNCTADELLDGNPIIQK